MEFDLPRTAGILVAIIILGVGGLAASGVMTPPDGPYEVLPSMAIFAAAAFWLGMRYGEHRSPQ
ncbi:hypothetical protein SAMN04487948_12425 [Halogranum amylolyticum]|uniref:Uncharacterized protein n=1 Tax=Halogranum amylolyticum TaxID=660520 RepID=A0A1H8W6S1_9EURY|nr:hypothetical protein [Halogranum amylolyticum]SEP23117.1 hypothetical protein SAMN04487948_12425 [Halogranum amylolyticum]